MAGETDGNDQKASQCEEEEGEVKGDVKKVPALAVLSKSTASSPRRPLTRSQTGQVPKRRRPDDSPSPDPRTRVIRASKKNKVASDAPVEASKLNDTTALLSVDKAPVSPPTGDPPPLNATQLAFLSASSSQNTDTSMDSPGAKSRAILPVPVPNLTKKSRGRRVPTRLPNDGGNIDPKDTRVYICKVESCGKCFHRGEHLKRHIRSIHTHEKPFRCTFPLCNKHFNRHDNLLQHLKVHKELATSESSNTDDAGSPIELRQNTPPPLSVESPPQLQPYYPAHEAYEASMKQARMAAIYQPPTSFHAYGSLSEPLSFAASMAVSSLRTEIPQSPPTLRTLVDRTSQPYHA